MAPKAELRYSGFTLGAFMSAQGKIIFTGPSRRGWHRAQQALECLQKYAYEYGTGTGSGDGQTIEKEESRKDPLTKGSLLHLVLAQHYARMYCRQNGQDPDTYMESLAALEFMGEALSASEFIPLIRNVYEAYVDHYRSDEKLYKIQGVERLFEHKIRDKYLFTGRLDLMATDGGGQLWAFDHKTTGRLTKQHIQFYAVSGQLIGYQYLAQRAYPNTAGLRLNLIELSDKPKFERYTLPRSPNLEAAFEQTIVDAEERIEAIQRQNRDIHNWPKAMNEMSCYGRYGACPHTDRCRWGNEYVSPSHLQVDFNVGS